jgi:hypothetical protein
MIACIFPIEPQITRQRTLEKQHNQLEFLRNVFNNRGEQLDKAIANSEAFVSEIFYFVFGSILLGSEIDSGRRKLIYTYLQKLAHPFGGSFPTSPTKDWQRKTRIYSTFYFLATFYMLGLDAEFFDKNREWSKNTISWLLSSQKKTGEDEGAFFESDCPMSISSENTYWALWCLLYFEKSMGFRGSGDSISKALSWIQNRFLREKRMWSITRLFFIANTLRMLNRLSDLSNEKFEEIGRYVNSLRTLDGYQEYPVSVKDGYRKESSQHHTCLHSALYAILMSKILRLRNFTYDDVSHLSDRFRNTDGFGSKVRIKEYNYGPSSTVFENCLTLLTYFSALPEDKD